jgi:hypothetical protein
MNDSESMAEWMAECEAECKEEQKRNKGDVMVETARPGEGRQIAKKWSDRSIMLIASNTPAVRTVGLWEPKERESVGNRVFDPEGRRSSISCLEDAERVLASQRRQADRRWTWLGRVSISGWTLRQSSWMELEDIEVRVNRHRGGIWGRAAAAPLVAAGEELQEEM